MEVTRELVFPVPAEEVWEALTDPEQLEEWFANDVELDPREGGEGVFRWENGEERRGGVGVRGPEGGRGRGGGGGGGVGSTLEGGEGAPRLHVRETSAEWSAALELRACALAAV